MSLRDSAIPAEETHCIRDYLVKVFRESYCLSIFTMITVIFCCSVSRFSSQRKPKMTSSLMLVLSASTSTPYLKQQAAHRSDL